jgi:GTPase involved in cell partitioning and DNA repair
MGAVAKAELTLTDTGSDAQTVKTAEASIGDVLAQRSFNTYMLLRKELGDYDADLLNKPEIVVINKIDITEVKESLDFIKAKFESEKVPVIGISGYTGENIQTLENSLQQTLAKAPKRKSFLEKDKRTVKVYTIDNLPNKRILQY